jgi:hypothetical protein
MTAVAAQLAVTDDRPYAVEELWYLLLSRRWSCLVLVSPHRTPKTLRLARDLAEFGARHRRRAIEIIDALELDMDRASTIARRIEAKGDLRRLDESRFIVALESPTANPSAIEVLNAADAVVLLVEKGVTAIPEARRVVEIVGRQRLVGAVFAVD